MEIAASYLQNTEEVSQVSFNGKPEKKRQTCNFYQLRIQVESKKKSDVLVGRV
jgi:hypothetical protein